MARRKKQINVEIGRNIRALRERMGMSRETFAETVGISDRFLASVEPGHVGISMETLGRICKCFNVSADSILFSQETSPSGYFDPILSCVDEAYYPALEDCMRTVAQAIQFAEKRKVSKG